MLSYDSYMGHTEFETREENPKTNTQGAQGSTDALFFRTSLEASLFLKENSLSTFPSGWNLSILTKPGTYLAALSMVQPSPHTSHGGCLQMLSLAAG